MDLDVFLIFVYIHPLVNLESVHYAKVELLIIVIRVGLSHCGLGIVHLFHIWTL